MSKSFKTYKSAASYSAYAMTRSGKFFVGGQYSSFNHKVMIHAEIGVILQAIASGDCDIVEIGIMSEKFVSSPVYPCGPCLQTIAELSTDYKFSTKIACYQYDGSVQKFDSLEKLLPYIWEVV